MATGFKVPGMSDKDAQTVIKTLQGRLFAYNDLHLTLKHVHWNVVGPTFISVHEMIDPQVEAVRGFADEVAERIATMGGTPIGTPGALVKARSWDEYSIGKDTAQAHLGALNMVYDGLIAESRKDIDTVGEVDPVTEDMLIGHTGQLEQFQWFIRAHLENAAGDLSTEGATSEKQAARKATSKKK